MAEGDRHDRIGNEGDQNLLGNAREEVNVVTQLVEGLVKAFDGCRVMPQTVARPGKYHGRFGDVKVQEWLREFLNYCDQCHVPEESRTGLLCSLLTGPALEEMLCHSIEVRGNLETVMDILCRQFGAHETVQDLQRLFYERTQREHESLMDFSRSLIRSYDKVIKAVAEAEKPALQSLKDKSLIRQFVSGARGASVRLELRRLELAKPDQTFVQLRTAVLDLIEESERVKPRQSLVREIETEALSVGLNSQKTASNPALHQLLQQQQNMLSKMVEQQQQQFVMQQQIMHIVQNLTTTGQKAQLQSTEMPIPYPLDRYPESSFTVPPGPQTGPVTCYRCGKQGHIQRFCTLRTNDTNAKWGQQQNNRQEN